MEQSTKERIFNIFKSVTPTKFENIDIEDEDLYTQITLKSIEIIAVIAALEKEFDIELPPQILSLIHMPFSIRQTLEFLNVSAILSNSSSVIEILFNQSYKSFGLT